MVKIKIDKRSAKSLLAAGNQHRVIREIGDLDFEAQVFVDRDEWLNRVIPHLALKWEGEIQGKISNTASLASTVPLEELHEPKQCNCSIKVVGIGKAGSRLINHLMEDGLEGVDTILVDTDANTLNECRSSVKVHIGDDSRSTGVSVEEARKATIENAEVICDHLTGSDITFIVTGLGGRTGTGAAPVIASLAAESGGLVIAVITTPFTFEGPRRHRNAESGLRELKGCVDSVVTISNDKLLDAAPGKVSFHQSFRIVDDVLLLAVKSIAELVIVPGIIGLEVNDIKTAMEGMGIALMGNGISSGLNRVKKATENALDSVQLEDNSVRGAKAILINVRGGSDLKIEEVNEVVSIVYGVCDAHAEIFFGAINDERCLSSISVTLIATGFSTQSRMLEEDDLSGFNPYVDPELRTDTSSQNRRRSSNGPEFEANEEKAGQKDAEKNREPSPHLGSVTKSEQNLDYDLADEHELDIPTYLRQMAKIDKVKK